MSLRISGQILYKLILSGLSLKNISVELYLAISMQNVHEFLWIGVKFRLVTDFETVDSGWTATIWLGCYTNASGYKVAKSVLVS